MSKKHKIKPAVAVNNRTADPYITLGAGRVESDAFWRWGDDNLFPNALPAGPRLGPRPAPDRKSVV